MRLLIPLLLLFTVGITTAHAQGPIMHLSGNAVIGTYTVTVTPSTPPPNSATLCSTGPYQIGKNYADGYTYTFNNPITHFTIKAIRFHDDDTMQVIVDGTPYAFTAGTAYNGDANCNLTSNGMVYPGNGMVTTTAGATGPGQGIELELSLPSLMQTVEIRHIRAANNNLASDIIYSAEFENDTCDLPFEATVSQPICAGTDIQLSATLYPNTTYQWTTNTTAPTYAPSANVREPQLINVSPVNTGNYTVTGTRGACVYTDVINIPITIPPTIGAVTQTGPECPGEADTLKAPNINIITGGTVYAQGPNGIVQLDPNNNYALPFPNVQLSDRGDYYIYAVDVQGCRSETVKYFFDVLTGVSANFNYKISEGCEEDTVVFTNSSVNHNTQTWSFGDGSPNSTASDPTHYYTVPNPNNAIRTYNVELIVNNGSCADTVDQDVELNHPLVADYTTDDDSICQGTVITFDNNSIVKPGTPPTAVWDLAYGDREIILDDQHTFLYDVAGIYHPKLVLTDYLGCVDSVIKEIVVDSTGGISFDVDKDNVCQGDEVRFTGDYYAKGAISVGWDFADGVSIANSRKEFHSYAQPGKYNVTYSIDYRLCPDLEVNKEITINEYPELYLGDDTAICPGSEPIFIGDIINPNSGDIKYTWNTTNRDVSRGIYVRSPGIYALTAEKDGCATTDSIEVKKDCYIDIPNVFTPNGDGQSDYFLPRQFLSRNVTQFNMQIYNRWGQKIFVTNAVDGRGWDGRYNGEEQPLGVYVYTIQVEFGNGVHEKYQGNVTLLR